MSKSKSNDSIDFQFISEKPKDGGLLFGHKEIVVTLNKVIEKSPESFTIGLYGDWGSGKSSIAETLQSDLLKKNIPLMIFDVWKHEGDALRRTFIKETHHFFKNHEKWKSNYKCTDDLLDDLSKSVKGTKKIPIKFWPTLKSAGILILTLAVLPIIAWLLLDKLLGVIDLKRNDLIASIVTLVSLFPISFLFKFILKFIENIKGDRVEYFQEKIQDPIEFENKFKELVNGLNKDIQKIVFVFDNLDRVSGEKAVQIISTIKTFLDPIDKTIKDKNIVFLVPCDETAIKKHLANTFSVKDNQYADEFLRKFFNTIIWIPEFYSTELQGLASDKLKETNVPDLDNINLAALIVIVFDRNPRQIIQFINILLANYLLIDERINQGKISGFSLENNITQLAKYLLLIQKFPRVMEVYKNELIYDLTKDIDEFADKKNYGIESHSLEEFKEFRDLTSQWHIESLDFYFKFRITQFEAAFENSTRLINLLQSNRIKDIFKDSNEKEQNEREYLDSLNIKTKTKELSNIVKQKVNTNNYPLIVTQFINGLLELTKHYGITLNDDAYREIYLKLRKSIFKSELYRIDINNLIDECINKINDTKLKASFLSMAKKQWINDFNNYHKKENNEE